MYGVTKVFTNDDLVSTKQSHDVDPLSRRLPNESFEFTILDYEHNYDPDNPAGVYKYLDEKSPIAIQFGYMLPSGTIEWIKADKYILNSKPTVKNSKATFKGTGLVGSLSGTYYKGALGSKNFYDMAEAVLLDAGLTLTEQGENPWEIDESLLSMFTTAALPIDTHMNCLQLIAHACRCRLFTDDDNVIHIKPFGVTVVGIYSGTWADNGHESYSEWTTVDKGNSVGNTYATLELNRWTLDGGDQVIIADTLPSGRGFVSDKLSTNTGVFGTNPVFTKTFDVSHDLPVLAIRFDIPIDEYKKLSIREFMVKTENDSLNSPERDYYERENHQADWKPSVRQESGNARTDRGFCFHGNQGSDQSGLYDHLCGHYCVLFWHSEPEDAGDFG